MKNFGIWLHSDFPLNSTFFFLLFSGAYGYEVGDVVAACNFDQSTGRNPRCEHFTAPTSTANYRVYFQSTYEHSQHTGPSEDHTSGTGMRINL